MYDPAQSGLFLHTNGDPTGPIYNEPIEFGDQFVRALSYKHPPFLFNPFFSIHTSHTHKHTQIPTSLPFPVKVLGLPQ